MDIKVPIEISARHLHLSKKDIEALFGLDYELKKMKQLSQPCDFSAQETLDLIINKKKITSVRIVGPEREQTQIEISLTDAINLSIQPPIRLSGNLKGSSGAIIKGPKGRVEIKEGLIIAQRHLHCATNEAEQLGLTNGMIVSVKTIGERELTFYNIIVRVRGDYKLCLHLDTDEGNATGINKKGEGILLKP